MLVSSLLDTLGYDSQAAADAGQAMELLESYDPHVVLCDLDLGAGPSGVDVLRGIARKSPWVARVILSSHRSPLLVDSDVKGLGKDTVQVTKNDLTTPEQLDAAIQAALNGERFVLAPRDTPTYLNKDQAEVLRMVSQGLTNEEIAQRRGTQVRAVEKMLRRIYDVMGLGESDSIHARVPAARLYQRSAVDVK